ncbi:MAG: efflux RND transporter periplasmic adaptor subunit [Rhodocyclaceae bacterium]|nr:efflux RND transporter periplasmic adaptor subunit [Rhodocyclaceae bacterium]
MKKEPNNARSGALRTGAALGVLALATAGLFTLRSGPADAGPAPMAPAATPVTVDTVTLRPIARWQEFSGRLEAVERVDLRPRVAGTVQSVHFREGGLVKKGDLLITIDPAPYAAEVDRAEAQVVAARARVAYTTSDAERAQRLWQVKAIAERELDERSNARREADAQLRAAEAALRSARLNLGYTEMRAPVAGRMGRLEVTVGNLVAAGPGAPVLTTLVSVSPIYASFDADEALVASTLDELPTTAGGRPRIEAIPVRMMTDGGDSRALAGHLQLVDNRVDTASGTVQLRAIFDNADGRLMPGQFARLQMGRAVEQEALLISERAVGTDQNKKYVMVVDADNHAQYREVRLGTTIEGLRIVTDGLAPGERVVVNGLQRIRSGSQVEPVAAGPAAAPARKVLALNP